MNPIARSLVCVLLSAWPLLAVADCLPAGHDRASLAALKAAGFKLEDTAARQALALALVDCLGDPDPTLRDGIVYEGLANWLRADALDVATRRILLDRLLSQFGRAAVDPGGFREPFAALVLSEVARTDRISPWLEPEQRADLVEAAARYVEGVSDYRGYDEREGWRHGVAHGADWLMQLALNPALDKSQLDRMLAAVASQVAPVNGEAYRYGESERLARPVLFALQRGLHSEAEWAAWVQGISAPAPLAAWSDAYASQAGLAKRHNTRFFLLALHAGLRESTDTGLQARAPAVTAALRAMD